MWDMDMPCLVLRGIKSTAKPPRTSPTWLKEAISFHVGGPHLLLPTLFGGKRRIGALEGSWHLESHGDTIHELHSLMCVE